AALPSLVESVLAGERPVVMGDGCGIDEGPFVRFSRVSAMVTISEGCSNFCSYCIVPFARGPLRSREPDRIVREVEEAFSSGYREVLLLGQNVDSYGRDRPEYGDFASLLDRVAATGIERIRFTSSHPADMTDRVLEAIASHRNVCRHLHLACQSGSDRILEAMRRGYTRERFVSIVRAAREIVPGINVTTDIIVGFPGETEEDFARTIDLLEECRFGSVFVAMYSPRPLTESGRLPDDVPSEVKRERLGRVLDLQRRIALEENERFIGREVEVLIEGEARGGAVYGRADDHRTVVAAGDLAVGDLATVRIEAASPPSLFGGAAVVQLERR
ncbi:MAG TPA: MiaB/RimO family radical SAM methylthiotransferase, partial [Candidatus Acetothermia bacterium]|nr:MiaB/RimO family radical SAM methylthiotransferase [Candidatus Acetothermia bacterium]